MLQGDTVVVCGVLFCTFYKLEGATIMRRVASLGTKGKMQRMMCIAWCDGDAVVGTGSGKLYRFKDNVLQQVYNAHLGGVTACFTCPAGIVTGGKDGIVKTWSIHSLEAQVCNVMQTNELDGVCRAMQSSCDLLGVGGGRVKSFDIVCMRGVL